MKLAICAMGELYGGVERQIVDLTGWLRRSGLSDPLVLLFHDRRLADRLRELGVEPVILSARHRYDPGLVGRLRGELDRHGIDVVHAHGYKATIVCGLARRKLDFSLVKTEHGMPEATLVNPVGWLKTRVSLSLEQYFTKRAVDHVCYVTDEIHAFFDDLHTGMARETVPNGIDPIGADDLRRPAELPEDRINVGIVGRVTRVKGIHFAIEALARADVPSRIHLVIVGTGRLVETLQRQAVEADVAGRVHFVGFQSRVNDYLGYLDALMMPSYHEGLPYTLLEAMSLARPVIASDVGGLAEVLTDGETGILVPVGDVAGLAAALNRIVQDSDGTRRIGEQSRRLQNERYTLEAMGQHYRRIWNGPVRGRSSGGNS